MRVVSVWLCVKDRKQEKIECNRMSVCYGLRVRGCLRVVCEKELERAVHDWMCQIERMRERERKLGTKPSTSKQRFQSYLC